MKTLTPEQLAAWRREGRPFRLVDVREPAEWALVRLEQAELLPLSEIQRWLPELVDSADAAPLVVYCHHGVRSARVCALLAHHGVAEVWNLSGGIEAWSQKVDPSLPRY